MTQVLERAVREAIAGVLETPTVSALHAIATLAIELHEAERLARIEQVDLSTAYSDHKSRTGRHTGIKRGSPEWEEMLEATKAEYAAVQDAKSRVKNARRRLRAAIDRYYLSA